MKRFWWFLIKLLASATIAGLLAGFLFLSWSLSQPLQHSADPYVIAQGSGIGRVARDLTERGIIKEPYSLIAWSYIKGTTREIHAGEYTFATATTLRELHQQIVAGRVKRYTVTIVEGWTFRKMLKALANTPKLRITLAEDTAEGIMKKLGQPQEPAEGQFFPDTYTYVAGTTDLDILRQARERMADHLSAVWALRAEGIAVDSPKQALILASIIEKETAVPAERTLISGVFHNRLRLGMRLQTDPTVIYGLGESYKGNLTRTHLRTDTAYNTYTRAGLPPTPIALPGRGSLEAAVRPDNTRALYFVARSDGTHVFSETLQEHNQAVIKYQLGGRPKPFSSYPGPETATPSVQGRGPTAQ